MKVWVVMPVYNALPYLELAVNSILGQTYKDFRFLIIDDGSTDGSYEFLKNVSDPRILLLRQSRKGPGEASNKALEICDAPFLARMDADDISDPERLERQIALLESYPNIAACSCNCYYIDEQGEIIGTSTVPVSPNLIRWEIIHGLRGLIQGATCFRTKALRDIGGYRPKFQRAEDTDVFIRLAEKYELGNCQEFLYKIRLLDNSYSAADTLLNSMYAKFALYCGYLRTRGKPEVEFSEFLEDISWQAVMKRFQARTETMCLYFWRNAMRRGDGKWPSKSHRLLFVLLASFFSPTRVVSRFARLLERYLGR